MPALGCFINILLLAAQARSRIRRVSKLLLSSWMYPGGHDSSMVALQSRHEQHQQQCKPQAGQLLAAPAVSVIDSDRMPEQPAADPADQPPWQVQLPGLSPRAQGIFPRLMLGARNHSTGLPLEDEQVQRSFGT